MDQTGLCEAEVDSDDVFVDKMVEWIPEVNAVFKPTVGKAFESLDEAEKFYKAYAKMAGFSVRNWTTKYDQKTGGLRSKIFVCSKEGKTKSRRDAPRKSKKIVEAHGQQEKENEICCVLVDMREVKNGGKKRNRNYTVIRENCKACVKVCKDEDGKWKVVNFVERHNHILATACNTHVHRSYGKHTLEKRLISTLNEASILAEEEANVGYLEKDICNVQRKEREERKFYDAQLLIEHFEELKEMNSSFFYAYELDEANNLKHCFWADGLARKCYHHFYDVVIFDMTRDTNSSAMIFAIFTGVNNHQLSVTFGCGFLRCEKMESFMWLFQKFLEAMSEVCPKSIITDQDPVMGAALAKIFPTSCHMFSTWHILKNETSKLGAIATKEAFSKPFHDCIWFSASVEEFESTWEKLMVANELQNHTWLCELYDIRHKWAPIFCKDIFSAGLGSIQHSETKNSFYCNYVSKHNSLMEFIIRFERAVKRQRFMELKQIEISEHTQPQLMTPFNIEKQMAGTYTRKVFKRFQAELSRSLLCFSSIISMDEKSQSFNVSFPSDKKLSTPSDKKSWVVIYDSMHKRAKCGCKKFESEGIPCSHLLYILRMIEGDTLPVSYILSRWTVSIVKQRIVDSNGTELRGDDGPMLRDSKNELHLIVSSWMDKAYTSKETLAFAKEMLTDIGKKLGMTKVIGTQPVQEKNPTEFEVIFRPEKPKIKGSGKHIKGAKEISIAHAIGRLCNGCKKQGVDHGIPNCPIFKKSQWNEENDVKRKKRDEDESSLEDVNEDEVGSG